MTSYAEIVLAPPRRGRGASRPSRTSSSRRSSCRRSRRCVAGRRPRDREEPVWAAQVMTVQGESAGTVQYETDRARFLGRGRGIRDPDLDRGAAAALEHGRHRARSRSSACAGGSGSRRARRCACTLRPSSPSRASRPWRSPTSTGTRPPSTACRASPGRRRRSSCATSGSRPTRRTSSSGWRRGSSTPIRRCAPRSRRSCETGSGPSALWRHGISGDIPIVLVRIDQVEDQGDRAPAPARPRVLEDEGPRGRSRDRERAAGVLLSGARRDARVARPRGQLARPASPRSIRPGASSCCAGSCSPARSATRWRRRRASSCSRGTARSRSRSSACCAGPPAARAPRPVRAAAAGRPAAAAHSARVLQRPGRLLGGGGASTSPSSASGSGRRPRGSTSSPTRRSAASSRSPAPATRGSVNSRENQLTPVVERSGRAIRPGRRSSCGTRRPERSGVRRRCRSGATGPTSFATARATAASSTSTAASRTDLTVFVPHGGSGQDLATVGREPVLRPRGRSRSPPTPSGCSDRSGAARRRSSSPSSTPRPGAIFARNSWNEAYAGRVAFADIGGAPTGVDGRSDRVPRTQRRPRRPGGARARRDPLAGASARASIPAPRCRCGCGSPPGERAVEVVFLLGQGRDVARGAAARARGTGRRTPTLALARGAPRVGRHAHRAAGPHARPFDGPDAQPLAPLPGARRAACGRGPPSTRRAAPGASATSCRT